MQTTLLVISNLPDEATALAIARQLVDSRLAACVNILPSVRSVYRWQGLTEEASETTLLIKTTGERYAELQAALSGMHPYDVPEIIAIPIEAGLPAYLAWLVSETKKEVDV